MTSIRDLAREYRAQEHEVRSFAPDMFTTDMRDTDELPADIVAAFRQAWGAAPGGSTRTPRMYSASTAVSWLVSLYVDTAVTEAPWHVKRTPGIAMSIVHLIARESGMTEDQATEWASDLVTDETCRRA